MTKATDALLHFIPAGMLALAIVHWPHGYYVLLRVVVFASGLLIAGSIFQRRRDFTISLGLFAIAAVIFNPIVPLHMTRGVWSILNITVAIFFVGHFAIEHQKAGPPTSFS